MVFEIRRTIMNLFTLSCFGDEISPDLKEQIAVMNANGVKALEFRSMDGINILDLGPNQLRSAAAILADAGIGVSAIGSPIGKIGVTDPFEPHLERFKHAVEVATFFNTPYIRMFSFFIPADQDPVDYRDEVLRRWEKFIEAARGSGLTLLHENEKGIYGDTAARCLDLLKSLNTKVVRATFDPANFIQCGEETFPAAYRQLEPWIAYIHIKDARRSDRGVVPAGQGDGKLPEILAALKTRGFKGYLSIEPHLNASLPGGGPELFKVAVDALKSVLAGLN
jgi:sugar phosphate isomerase/epimerase